MPFIKSNLADQIAITHTVNKTLLQLIAVKTLLNN